MVILCRIHGGIVLISVYAVQIQPKRHLLWVTLIHIRTILH